MALGRQRMEQGGYVVHVTAESGRIAYMWAERSPRSGYFLAKVVLGVVEWHDYEF